VVKLSMLRRLRDLETFVEDFHAGQFPQRSVAGPGTLDTKFIKSKSIAATLLDVSELAAVSTNTGALSVTGDFIAGSGATTMGYSPGNGLYIGHATPGSAPFRVNNGGDLVATSATITGAITASTLTAEGSGSIAGFTIDGVNGVKYGSGATTRGISRGSTTFYAGSATPGSAPFRVSSAGALVASSATITGTINTGTLTATGGTIGGLTINASDLTIGSGKKIYFGSGQNDYLGDDRIHLEVAASSVARIDIGDGGTTYINELRGAVDSTWSDMTLISSSAGSRAAALTLHAANADNLTSISMTAWPNSGNVPYVRVDSDGDVVIDHGASAANFATFRSDGHVTFEGHFFPGTGTGPQSTSYISSDGTGGLDFTLGDDAGTDAFYIRDSGANDLFGVNSNGQLIRPITNDSTALGSYFGRVPIYINGSLKYLAVYS